MSPKPPPQIGYDRILDGERSPEKVVSRTVDFLEHAPPQPFFLDVGFFVTHREFPEPGPDEDPRYCLPPAPMPDTPENRYDMAAYKASASILDNSIGAVLDVLDENGLAENTLVICTTDHGLAFPGMKCNLTDHGIGVMLIMRGPGGFTRRKSLRCDGFPHRRASYDLRSIGDCCAGGSTGQLDDAADSWRSGGYS